jgi:hypothetical protein
MIKIQDGDLYKILPILDKDKKIIPVISCKCLYLPKSKSTLYDFRDDFLHKIFRVNPKLMIKKHFISAVHNGKVDWISVGKTLFEKIISEPNALNLNTDTHLKINVDFVNAGSFSLPNYDKSTFVEHEWQKPFNHKDPEIWKEWLIQNQKPMWDFLHQNEAKLHVGKIQEELSDQIDLSKIISEFRDKKLDLILE